MGALSRSICSLHANSSVGLSTESCKTLPNGEHTQPERKVLPTLQNSALHRRVTRAARGRRSGGVRQPIFRASRTDTRNSRNSRGFPTVGAGLRFNNDLRNSLWDIMLMSNLQFFLHFNVRLTLFASPLSYAIFSNSLLGASQNEVERRSPSRRARFAGRLHRPRSGFLLAN